MHGLRDALKLAGNEGEANISFDSTAFPASNSTAANTILLSNGRLTTFRRIHPSWARPLGQERNWRRL